MDDRAGAVEVDADNVTIDIWCVRWSTLSEHAKNLRYFIICYAKILRSGCYVCNRRSSTERVSENLIRLGVPCEVLSGDVQQNKRLRVLEDFRSGKVRVVRRQMWRGVACTDGINFVVNYDPMKQTTTYTA